MHVRHATYSLPLAALLLFACGPQTSTVRGKVTDGSGSQPQLRGLSQEKFGGSGTVASTSQVAISSVGPGGQLTAVATADVAADGSYSVEVPSGETRLVVQALSSSGEVLAQAIVESTGSAGSTQTAPPMDGETSLEAAVLIQAAAEGASIAETNAVDLRARITSEMAAQLQAAQSNGTETAADVRALAQAVISAQRARAEWYQRQGTTVTQNAVFQAQLQAAAALNVALDQGSTSSAAAYESFFTAMAQAEEQLGVSAETRAEGESNSSSAFRAVIEARLSTAGTQGALRDASLRAAASLEGRASSAAVEAILEAGGAASSVQTAAANAGTQLQASLSAASSVSASASAFAAYQASISGSSSVSGSVLGNYLAVDSSTQVQLQGAVDAAVNASADLSGSLNTALSLAIGLTGAVDFDAVANATCDAYASYKSTVEAQSTALASFGANAAPAIDVLVVTQASFN